MDLAKIIGELRLELQCLDAAIASVEELARVQKLSGSAAGNETPVVDESAVGDAPPQPLKRPRGRPRKVSPQAADSATGDAPGGENGDSTPSGPPVAA